MAKKRGKALMPIEGIGLPPKDVWLIDTKKEKIPTPTNEWGFVNAEQLIDNVKEAIDPNYEWLPVEADKHHLNWPEKFYASSASNPAHYSPHEFRALPMNMAMISREFHNWIHEATEPPELPDEEIMHVATDAYKTAVTTFDEAKGLVRLQRHIEKATNDEDIALDNVDYKNGLRPEMSLEKLIDIQARRIDELHKRIGELSVLPKELKIPEIHPEQPPELIGRLLGKIAVPEAMHFMRRAVA